MATNATAQFWIRTDGNDANGGGYDAAISGAVTNYCDQAAAQASWTDLQMAVAGTLTDHGATGLFTSAMIGNAVQVSAQGYYWITGFTNSNTVTVQAGTGAAATFTAGKSGKVGGAFRQPTNLNSGGGSVAAPTTPSPLAAGNTNNVRHGSGTTGSPDYTQTGYATYVVGDTTGGRVRWVGYNGQPVLGGNGLMFYTTSMHYFENLYLVASSGSNGSYGFIGQTSNVTCYNCVFDAANQSGMCAFGDGGSGSINLTAISCELKGGGSTSSDGVRAANYAVLLMNCSIHGWGGWGVVEMGDVGVRLTNCAVWANTTGGVSLLTTSLVVSGVIGCTIDGNGGDGIRIASTTAAKWAAVINNNITANGGYGLNVNSGAAAVNSATVAFADYNNYGTGGTANTSGAYHNISAGAHDLAVGPGYTNASAGQFTPSNSALIAAAPIGFA